MRPTTLSPAFLTPALLLLVVISTTSAQQCYFPDGSTADEYAPCGANNPHCCYNTGPEYDDACFSNGMCYSWMMGYTYRGACTDQEWGESCVQECKGHQSGSISPVSFCGGADDSSTSAPYACCGTPPEAADCCSSGDDPSGFLWYNASIVNFKLTPIAPLDSATSMTASTATGSGATTATGPVASSTGTDDPTATSSPGSGSDQDEKGDPLERKGNQIALGLGLGIGLATLFVTSWGVWKQRSKISPIMFLKSPGSMRRPQLGRHRPSDQVPLQAGRSEQALARPSG